MDVAKFLQGSDFILFLLLFVRFSAFFSFLPFFSHASIPATIKASLAFFMTILFFPLSLGVTVPEDSAGIFLAILSEAMFGFFAGFILNLSFSILTAAVEQISMMMGFSMATAFDPASGQSSQIISQFLSMLMLLILLAFDGHHLMIQLINTSLQHLPPGGFSLTNDMVAYTVNGMKHLFLMGFVMAFPIVALSTLSDIIFGMIMKTMPTFNLLVVGFPIKIVLSVIVLTTTLGAMTILFRNDFSQLLQSLSKLLF